jgi:1,2-diacylglycerol 3-beta-galactosyltransferase
MSDRPRILFLFSDTGGGHRSAAEAIIEALTTGYPGCCDHVLVDVFKDYAPKPFDLLPDSYTMMTSIPQAWELGFRILDSHRRGRAITSAFWPYVRNRIKQLVEEQPADLVVSVHPLLSNPVLKALGKDRPRFVTVVTDLVTGPALWYDSKVDLTIVPTREARRRALECGVPPERVLVIGLPVSGGFSQTIDDESEILRQLGWPEDRPVVLLVGGAEGMGPLYETAKAIARQDGDFALAVVTGRNKRLRERLESVKWEVPLIVHGFERRMPLMMQAATLLVTKAGPGTITEAINVGLPIVLYARIPGQEDGNVDYVVDKGVGSWAPTPSASAAAVRKWLVSPELLKSASEACRKIARPNAAMEIADVLIANLPNGKVGNFSSSPVPDSRETKEGA